MFVSQKYFSKRPESQPKFAVTTYIPKPGERPVTRLGCNCGLEFFEGEIRTTLDQRAYRIATRTAEGHQQSLGHEVLLVRPRRRAH